MRSIVIRSSGSEQSAKGGNEEFSPEDTFNANDQDNRARRTILIEDMSPLFYCVILQSDENAATNDIKLISNQNFS